MEQETTNTTNEPEKATSPEDLKLTADLERAHGSKKSNFKTIAVIVLIVAALVGFYFLAKKYKSLVIAAKVDGVSISRFKVLSELEQKSGKQVLEVLINKQLIINEAKANNITVSDEEVDKVIKDYEDTYSAAGTSLDTLLEAQGLSREKLREEVFVQQKLEKLLADKISVTDEEVDAFIKDNQVKIGEGEEDQVKSDIREQLKMQKFDEVAPAYLEELKDKANIQKFIDYK